jgi:hypothetical protein
VKVQYKILVLFLSFIITVIVIDAMTQSKDIWFTLGMVTFETSYDPEYMLETKKPRISQVVDKLGW